MTNELVDEILAAVTASDPDAPSREERNGVHLRRRDEWRAWVAKTRERVDDSTTEGRRLRRALDHSVVSADRLVRALLAVQADEDAIREVAEAIRDREGR